MNTGYPTLNFGLGEEMDMLRDAVYQIYVDEKVKNYIVDIVLASREPEKYGLALTLGSAEVKMTEMGTVFGSIANMGKRKDLEILDDLVGYKKEDVISYIKLKSKRLGFRPEFVVQKKPLGTGDALKTAFSELKGESFLTVYGDLYYDKRIIRSLLKRFERDPRFNYIVLVKKRDVTQYGLVKAEGGEVKRAYY